MLAFCMLTAAALCAAAAKKNVLLLVSEYAEFQSALELRDD